MLLKWIIENRTRNFKIISRRIIRRDKYKKFINIKINRRNKHFIERKIWNRIIYLKRNLGV